MTYFDQITTCNKDDEGSREVVAPCKSQRQDPQKDEGENAKEDDSALSIFVAHG